MAGLTVVLITHNQEWNVRRLIESVLADTAVEEGTEVVVVDSASSDATVEIASGYPVTILRLRAGQHLTAAAGRKVGHAHGSGSYTLFLDGDMELAPGWLELARHYLEANPDVAAVTGVIVDLPKEADANCSLLSAPTTHAVRAIDVKHGRGTAMYRRSALDRVGSFNPYLYSDEEPELAIRIHRAGYRIVRLDRPIAFHYTEPRERIGTLLGRRRRRLFLGTGQNVRFLLGKPELRPYLRERGFGVASVAALVAWLANLAVCLKTGRRLGLALVLAVPFGVFGLQTLRKRSVYRAAYSGVHRLLIIEGTVRGLVMKLRHPDTDPLRFDVVRAADTNLARPREAR